MQKGRIKSWIDERGFGFIQPDDGSEALFFHVSALKVAGRRPVVGDVVLFQVNDDGNGRKKADAVSIEGVESVFAGHDVSKHPLHLHHPRRKLPPKPSTPVPTYHRPRKSVSKSVAVILSIAVVVVAAFAWVKFDKPRALMGVTTTAEMAKEAAIVGESNFRCQGKTQCTQMTSCAEATFYLNNCPGSVTDGDGDGRPCEDQWCGH